MKFSQTYLIAINCLLLICCSKDDSSIKETDSQKSPLEENPIEEESSSEVEKEIYFTFQSFRRGWDEWIILHDGNGVLIDYKLVGNAEEVVFKTNPDQIPESIIATRLQVNTYNEVSYHSFTTFTDLIPGSTWKRPDTMGPDPYTTNGTFDFIVDNVLGGVRSYNRSTSYGIYNPEETIFPGTAGDLSFQLLGNPVIDNENYIFSLYNGLGENKYIIVENPLDKEVFRFDFSELQDYDNYLEIDLPETTTSAYMSTFAFPENEPNYSVAIYQVSGFIGLGMDSVKVGYLDQFSNYGTYVSINMENYSYAFSQTGDRVENVTILPEPIFSLEDSSVFNLRFASDRSYIRKKVNWKYPTDGSSPTMRWVVFSSGGEGHLVGDLPSEIVEKYPELKLENLELEYMELYTRGQSQQQYFELQDIHKQPNESIKEFLLFRNF